MEYMDGPTLAVLVRTGPLPAGVAIHVARELLAGLGYLHAARLPGRRFGLAHCDIAPENVLAERPRSDELAHRGLGVRPEPRRPEIESVRAWRSALVNRENPAAETIAGFEQNKSTAAARNRSALSIRL